MDGKVSLMEHVFDEFKTVDEEPVPLHLTCHCSDFMVSACRIDLSDYLWASDAEHLPNPKDCSLCYLEWPDGEPCPWGCTCEYCLI
jgi:hypothetical protein